MLLKHFYQRREERIDQFCDEMAEHYRGDNIVTFGPNPFRRGSTEYYLFEMSRSGNQNNIELSRIAMRKILRGNWYSRLYSVILLVIKQFIQTNFVFYF